MSAISFVRMYPGDWRSGCLGLSMEEEGLYMRICMFQAETNRRVPLDDAQAARLLGGANINQYRKVLGQLLLKGKVKRHEDGFGNDRIEHETKAAQSAARKRPAASERGTNREADPDEGREDYAVPVSGPTPPVTPPVTPLVEANFSQQDQTPFIDLVVDSKKQEGAKAPLSNEDSTPSDEIDAGNQATLELETVNGHASKTDPTVRKQFSQPVFEAFNAYLAMAKRAGLPEPRTMTPQMRKSIGARLRESNLDCWMEAMDNVEGSKFLQGQNDRGWCADLTWIVKPANYEKILAGNYINRDTSTEYSYGQPARKHAILAALDDLRDRFEPIN